MHYPREIVIQKRLWARFRVRVRVMDKVRVRLRLGLGLWLTKNDSRSFFKTIVVHFLLKNVLCVRTS